jgi:hypothetical protein
VVSPYLRAVKAASGATAALQLAGQSAGGRRDSYLAVPATVVSHVRQGGHT